MTDTHARAFDLPGWPCPPRVRDIPNHVGSWGYVPCHMLQQSDYSVRAHSPRIAQDELGFLWADGDVIPQFRTVDPAPGADINATGAILAWTERGLGVYVHSKSLQYIGSISKLDMEPDRWIPIAVALAEIPKEARA